MGFRTFLYEAHLDAGGRIVDFGGWDMPLHYGSQIEEHKAVRRSAGMFDVSHMTVIDVSGADRTRYLQKLLANDVGKLSVPGKALYSAMLNEQGGVLDDLIVYFLPEMEMYRVVVNCATREKDLSWMSVQAKGFAVDVRERPDLAMIAVQGPDAIARVKQVVDASKAALIDELTPFQGGRSGEWLLCRTGYTGEDGLEVILPGAEAMAFWKALLEAGVQPCGLGARDTLRLEAGMNLYGADMDESVTPLESNMGWTVAWAPESRDFIGRPALEAQRSSGVPNRLVGLVMKGRGVLRAHQKVSFPNGKSGVITSGSFSPTLGYSIAFARIPADAEGKAMAELRGKQVEVEVVRPPFVRNGKPVYTPVS